MSTLVVRELSKSFGRTTVLDRLDLTVPRGALAAVLGASGCGKTTLLRILAGFERADAGTVEADGHLIGSRQRHVPPEKRRIGIVPQEGALFPHLTVWNNVAFGLPRRGRAQRVREVLDLVGLVDLGRRMPHELSGGQQQRVALARALAPNPSLVLLDEPFNALDPGLRAEVRAEVRAVLRDAGATGVLVTHDQEEALSTADMVALLRGGHIVQAGTPRDVYTQPRDVTTAGFLGETVVLDGKTEDGRVVCPLGILRAHSNGEATNCPGTVVLRPEQLVLDPDSGVPAQVKDTQFQGHDTVARLCLAECGTEVNARLHAYPPPEVGSRVRVRVAGEVSFFPGTVEPPSTVG
ncbi:ABC transporter ATP-binding protein [Lipingzhangella sp. LS1_29]|uniref:ABC transporter ATP-binding protein n=1 Tax=Lipingzhangella rawalii TaxID=2055835 RepID=A0ABU2HCS6_9ACTN|nr:ABC transporter ATP-binding protein [Lipingzhangella rawalii]MDS1272640.1 ABC transporter ATP-binding protein [Lipingzhangella rawalii]